MELALSTGFFPGPKLFPGAQNFNLTPLCLPFRQSADRCLKSTVSKNAILKKPAVTVENTL